MDYSASVEYIHKISNFGSRPGLERITELCRRLGDPQDGLRFVHVGGTNGKGSFCCMLSSVLRASGLKTGLYTSPYVRRFNERIMIDGAPISDEDLAEYTTIVKHQADLMKDKPTEFETITALAFKYFSDKKCDVVVLEVGLGGRLDATNVIKTPVLSVITGISLDHTAILGSTEYAIAGEKAGIFKKGVPCCCAPVSSSAARRINAAARDKGCPLTRIGRGDIKITRCVLGQTRFDYGRRKDVELNMSGLYQPRNAAKVIDAADILAGLGFCITEQSLRKGLASAFWPARFDVMSRDPVTVFDGGHNPEGISALCESLGFYFPGSRVVILSGVMKDKDSGLMVKELSQFAEKAFTFAPKNPRALDPEQYAGLWRANGVCAESGTARESLSKAAEYAKGHSLPLIICGSLCSYEEISALLGK